MFSIIQKLLRRLRFSDKRKNGSTLVIGRDIPFYLSRSALPLRKRGNRRYS